MTDFLFLLQYDPKFLLRYYLVVAQEKVQGAMNSLQVHMARLKGYGAPLPGSLQG
ncbi:hypothetical protein [Rhizobium sp. CECT 9324]|uniref:hypothetical protein n=1 Tax=Rhizobium sp. CECT 9324 TaxID=2845820 RepID=UPI001E407C67|nr:hypothetical protein [Rhizobium sp. CECT 9324]CAH0343767.1 hypothetical protein RHI9324_05505 [Rhizobium sp. CECT 9324]